MYNAVDKLALFLPLGLPHRKSTFFTIFTSHISNIFNSIISYNSHIHKFSVRLIPAEPDLNIASILS
jgi:hypothetical protein